MHDDDDLEKAEGQRLEERREERKGRKEGRKQKARKRNDHLGTTRLIDASRGLGRAIN